MAIRKLYKVHHEERIHLSRPNKQRILQICMERICINYQECSQVRFHHCNWCNLLSLRKSYNCGYCLWIYLRVHDKLFQYDECVISHPGNSSCWYYMHDNQLSFPFNLFFRFRCYPTVIPNGRRARILR